MMEDHIKVNARAVIPKREISFRLSRSGGPGGQHVNKTETRVELMFDVKNSPSLNDRDRETALTELSGYADTSGVIHITVDTHRSQLRNKEESVERLVLLLRKALAPKRHRIPTNIPRAQRETRLRAKKVRGERKRLRGGRDSE
jgi:ribosome-associated protein